MMIAGKTGSGKTTFAEKLLPGLPNVVIIDSKAEWKVDGAKIVTDPNGLDRLRQGSGETIIFAPDPEFDDYLIYDAVFAWVYQRKHTTLYIDELFAVFKLGADNRNLRACLARGRSRGITTIAAMQRPSRIPLEILTESEHRLCFKMDWLDDRKRMAEVMPGEEGKPSPVLKPVPERFAFWYQYEHSDEAPKAYKLQM